MDISIRPDKSILKTFLFISIFISISVGTLFIIIDGFNLSIILTSLILGGLCFATFLIALAPYLLFERVYIENNVLIYRGVFPWIKQGIQIQQIERIEEQWRRGRKGSTHEIVFKSHDKKITFGYKRFNKSDLKQLIKEILRINKNVINEFDVIDTTSEKK